MVKKSRFTVQGKPFFPIGGQTFNSSSYILTDMKRAWNSVKALGGNTVETPVPWDAFEPMEGKYRIRFVTDLIDAARAENLKLILLWFGTWKNGTMEYCPAWVKQDTERFQRALLKDGTALHQLSAHSENNLAADRRAFIRLMELLRDYDGEEQTVIGVQVENEAGILGGTRRDFSPLGQAAFESDVPEILLDYCRENPDCYLAETWRAAGGASSGNWITVFGRYGAEAVTTCAVAHYIDTIAAAGKAVYPDVFVYANVWMDGGRRGLGMDLAGIDWPSGCATIHNIDIYYAICRALDTIAPDNYQMELTRFREVTKAYTHPEKGYPLFVPESAANILNATQMFDAIANYGAIGYHIFGCERCLAPDGETISPAAEAMMHSMHMLAHVTTLIEQFQGTSQIHAAVQYPGEGNQVIQDLQGKWKCMVNFGAAIDAWPGMDFRHPQPLRGAPSLPPDPETGRCLIFQVSESEFYVVGHNVRLLFIEREPMDGSIPVSMAAPGIVTTNVNYIEVTEGHFDDVGDYVVDVVRSGDEVRHSIWCQWDVGVIRILLM